MNYRYLAGAVLALFLAACGGNSADETTAPEAGHGENAAEPAKGPHRGRLLSDGDFQLEIAIFESGVPPEFHLYATAGGKPIRPEAVQARVELTRLGNERSVFTFVPEGDHLKGSGHVKEPHSFKVKVEAEYAGRKHLWTYDSFEGRTTIAADIAAAAGVKSAVAGAGVVREALALYGSIQPNAERVRSVVARFSGPIRSVAVQVGDRVAAGQTLAIIESNDSLREYAVTAPIAGVVTQRAANPGEAAGSDALFVISDFRSVWAELTVFARDRARLKTGQPVQVRAAEGEHAGTGTISYISVVGTPGNQSLIARVVLDNADGLWTPGLFIKGVVTIGETRAPLVVRNTGLQAFRDFTVVFAQVGDTYEVRMLELGQSDGEFTEVLGGLDPGTVYVADNSYLIKADVEKSGASHDH